MTFMELKEATLRLSMRDRWRLLWSILRSMLSEIVKERSTNENETTEISLSSKVNFNQESLIHSSWSADFVQKTAGKWHGKKLVRADQGMPEERDILQ